MKVPWSYHYLWWIPIVILYYTFYTWVSKNNNEIGGKWFWYTLFAGMFWPGWLVVSKISKNLLFDGMLYDNLLFLTYVMTMIYLGVGDKLLPHQWGGLGLIIFGSILLRWHL